MEKRIRGVHYRNQPIKVLAKYDFGLVRIVGFDQDKDQPVEVIKLPKVFPDIEKLNMILNTFDSYKELGFSKYFSKYLGFNTVADPDYNLYFLEMHTEPSLADLLDNSPYKLVPTSMLFRYWAREIFLAFSDLLSMCTYSFMRPLRLIHIFSLDSGTKIILSNMNFTERRCRSADSQEVIEADLFKNYGKILLQLLNYNDIEEMRKSEGPEQVELVTFIETLLNAKRELRRYLGILGLIQTKRHTTI